MAKTIFKKMLVRNKKKTKTNEPTTAVGPTKTRHGRTSTATSSTTTTFTTRDAQSHKHAPSSQFSFWKRIQTTAARGVNKRLLFLFRRETPVSFTGREMIFDFLIVHLGCRDYGHCSPRANHHDYDHTKMVTNLLLNKNFTGFTVDNTVKINPFCH